MVKKIFVCFFILFTVSIFLQSAKAESYRCTAENVKQEFTSYLQTRQFQKCVDLANVCINENPEWYQMYNNRGIAYKNLGKYDLALADFDKALSLNPEYFIAYISKANLKLQRKDYKGALIEVDKVIKLVPSYPHAYYLRGTIKMCSGDYKGALEDYNKTYALDKNYPGIQTDINTAKYTIQQKALKGAAYHPSVKLEVKNNILKLQK